MRMDHQMNRSREEQRRVEARVGYRIRGRYRRHPTRSKGFKKIEVNAKEQIVVREVGPKK
jgi:hypothetical protein